MSRKRLLMLAGSALLAIVSVPTAVRAAWPSGQIRTISGQWCNYNTTGPGLICPYASDSVDFFGDNCTVIYADYVQEHVTGGSIQVSACRQSYTGGAAVCGAPGTSSTNGEQDTLVSGGFKAIDSIAGAATQWDYFYVALTGSDAIQTIWGAGFEG